MMAEVQLGMSPNIGEMPVNGTDKEKLDFLMKAYTRLEDCYVRLQKDAENSLQTLDSSNVKTLDADVTAIGNLVVGGTVAIGNAQDASGVTTIIGNTVNTTFLNARNITAGSVAAENVTGTYLTGKTIRTAASGTRMELKADGLITYNASGQKEGVSIEGGAYSYSNISFYDGSVQVAVLEYDSMGTFIITNSIFQ